MISFVNSYILSGPGTVLHFGPLGWGRLRRGTDDVPEVTCPANALAQGPQLHFIQITVNTPQC